MAAAPGVFHDVTMIQKKFDQQGEALFRSICDTWSLLVVPTQKLRTNSLRQQLWEHVLYLTKQESFSDPALYVSTPPPPDAALLAKLVGGRLHGREHHPLGKIREGEEWGAGVHGGWWRGLRDPWPPGTRMMMRQTGKRAEKRDHETHRSPGGNQGAEGGGKILGKQEKRKDYVTTAARESEREEMERVARSLLWKLSLLLTTPKLDRPHIFYTPSTVAS